VPEDPVVLRVRPDPEPHQVAAILDCQRSMMQADPSRPEATNLLQVQRRVPQVLSKHGITGVRQPLDLDRQWVVTAPESRGGG
jgi:hypothetical protein